jgi:hypothetical protein
MANSIDQAYERLLKIRAGIEAAITVWPNEADTRLKVLDRILFEVLDWRHAEQIAEEFQRRLRASSNGTLKAAKLH